MKKLLLTLVATVVAIPAFAQATAPAQIAVIDVQRVLAQSAPGKAAYERLKKMQDDRAAKLQSMNNELKSLDEQINGKKMSLAEDKLAEMNKQFAEKKIALQRFAQDAEREMGEARDRQLQELEKQILPVINALGKEMGFAMIFNKYESGLVYASAAIEITDMVVKRFNDSKTGAPAPAAPPAASKK